MGGVNHRQRLRNSISVARELEKGPLGPEKVGTQRRIISSFFSPPPLVSAIPVGKVLIEGEGGGSFLKAVSRRKGSSVLCQGGEDWQTLAGTYRLPKYSAFCISTSNQQFAIIRSFLFEALIGARGFLLVW